MDCRANYIFASTALIFEKWFGSVSQCFRGSWSVDFLARECESFFKFFFHYFEIFSSFFDRNFYVIYFSNNSWNPGWWKIKINLQNLGQMMHFFFISIIKIDRLIFIAHQVCSLTIRWIVIRSRSFLASFENHVSHWNGQWNFRSVYDKMQIRSCAMASMRWASRRACTFI